MRFLDKEVILKDGIKCILRSPNENGIRPILEIARYNKSSISKPIAIAKKFLYLNLLLLREIFPVSFIVIRFPIIYAISDYMQ